MQKKKLNSYLLMEKLVEKMVGKKWYFEIFILGKTQKSKVFILQKVKMGVGVYFSGAI